MKVTVFMPVYNGEKFIKKAVESILNQTFKDFELLIIDDGSTDKTIEILKKFKDDRINLIKNNENKGLPYTRNLSLDLARGEYIANMDSDDIAMKDRLEKQVKYLDNNREIALIGSSYVMIDENEEVLYTSESFQNPNFIRAMLILENCVGNSTIMFRKKFICENKIRYDEKCFIAQDYKFLGEVSLVGKISCLNDILIKYRTGHNNITKNSIKNKNEERKKILYDIKSFFIKAYSLGLEREELELFCEVFIETGVIDSVEKANDIQKLLNKMQKNYIKAMEDGHKEFKDAIRIKFCDKLKGLKTIWDL